MKIENYLLVPVSLCVMASCSQDEIGGEATFRPQTIVINATTASGEDATRASYEKTTIGDLEAVNVTWKVDDKVTFFTSDTNFGTLSVSSINSDNSRMATLSGQIPQVIVTETPVAAFVENTNVKLVDNNKHIEVDLSNQDGSFEDAMTRSLLFANATYKPGSAGAPTLNFRNKMSFLKMNLDFGAGATGKASLRITGTNVCSLVWINSIYNGGGGTNKKETNAIIVPSVTLQNGIATAYIAIYPQAISNATIQAQLDNGDVYNFALSTDAKKITSGTLYTVSRNGTKVGNVNQAATAFSDGDGTANSPYQIATISELRLLQEKVNAGDQEYISKNYILTGDIAIDGEWKPIGTNTNKFQGSFDGAGHYITGNISVSNVMANEGAGIFGVISGATIKNLNNQANITVSVAEPTKNNTFVGGIAGRALYKNTIVHCSNSGAIVSNAGFTGGILGQLYLSNADGAKVNEARIEACWNTADITNNVSSANTTSMGIGGIVGSINTANEQVVDKAIVVGCYNKDTNLGFTDGNKKPAYVAGIVGYVSHKGTEDKIQIYACWNSAKIMTGSGCAAIVGSSSTTLYDVHDCWSRWIANVKRFGMNSNLPYTGCKNGNETRITPYSANVTDMNNAWASPTYCFNLNTGEIVAKY